MRVVTQYKGAASEQCKDMRMGRVATMCKDALVRARDPEGISKYKRSAMGSILMPNKTVVWPNTGEPLVRIISGFDLTVTRAVRAQHSKTEHTKKEGEKEDEKEGEKEGEEEETVDEVLLLQVKPTQEEFCYQSVWEAMKDMYKSGQRLEERLVGRRVMVRYSSPSDDNGDGKYRGQPEMEHADKRMYVIEAIVQGTPPSALPLEGDPLDRGDDKATTIVDYICAKHGVKRKAVNDSQAILRVRLSTKREQARFERSGRNFTLHLLPQFCYFTTLPDSVRDDPAQMERWKDFKKFMNSHPSKLLQRTDDCARAIRRDCAEALKEMNLKMKKEPYNVLPIVIPQPTLVMNQDTNEPLKWEEANDNKGRVRLYALDEL